VHQPLTVLADEAHRRRGASYCPFAQLRQGRANRGPRTS
jgi:hypothetical protein